MLAAALAWLVLAPTMDVPYVRGVADPLQALDIYPVTGSAPAPVLVIVHGGGWHRGSRKQMRAVALNYAEHGFVAVAADYRLAPDHQHPAHVEDVAAALAWVLTHVGEYGGDARHVFVMGHSAGAHLAALAVLDPQYLAALGFEPSDLAGVIPVDTATFDLSDLGSQAGEGAAAAFGNDPAVLRAASPLHAVQDGVLYPPFLIPYCAHRVTSSGAESEELAARLGSVAKTLPAPGKVHSSILRDQGQADDPVFRAILEWMLEIVEADR